MLNNIMDFVFWPIMIFSPAVWLACVRTPPGVTIKREEVQRLTRWVWFWTILAAALFVVLYFVWPDFPRPMILGAIAPAFTFTLRALPLKNPDWGAHDPTSGTRNAVLVNRRPTLPVTKPWWIFAWLLGGGMLLAVILRAMFPFAELPERREHVLWLVAITMSSVSILEIAIAMWAVSRTREEPEPRDARNSPQIDQSYSSLRNFRAWCFYWMFAIVMPLLFGGFALVLAWMPLDANSGGWLGLAGGIAGSLVGIGGAIFGIVAGMRRVRINRELRELQKEERQAAV